MKCQGCEGTGWKRRLVPHPGIKGCMVRVTSICTVCHGKGYVNPVLAPSGKDHASNDSDSCSE